MKKNKNAPRPNFPNTRKALRKQKRKEKKVKRVEHYSKKKNPAEQVNFTPGRFVKRPAETTEDLSEVHVKKKQKTAQLTALDILSNQRKKDIKETDKLKLQMDDQRKRIFQQANDDEDKIIKKLEKQLGLNKTKNKNNFFADDGLDYLLEICDRTTTEQIVAAEKHLANVEDESDFDEDLAAVTGKEISTNKKKRKTKGESQSETEDDDGSEDDLSDEDDELQDDEILDDDELSGDKSAEDSEDIGDSSEVSDVDDDAEDKPPKKQSKKVGKSKIDKKTNVTEKVKGKTITQQHSNDNIDDADDLMSGEEIENPFSDDEVSHLSGDGDDEDFSNDENDKTDEVNDKKPDVWEDIYGRKRDKEGNIIKEEKGVYIPPHLRDKDSSSDKELAQLKRQIKSVLNKLAGTNLHWACTSIENLYSNNSRHSVNSCLASLWLDATAPPHPAPPRLVAEHSALLAVLHANVGQEVGAHFLQILVKKCDELMMSAAPVEDKTLDNLICCLSHMYAFKMYQADLLYDILNRLLEDLTEKNIECILVCLRTVGGVLRKEQPLALKTFIQNTQNKIGEINPSLRTRLSFLQEVLLAVKNNNLTKIPNYDPTYTELLKKTIRTVIRKGNYVTPLNIRLDDLLKADERGKWWVVGSAWEGTQRPAAAAAPAAAVDQKLLELARKQRMNTDVRRSIFCIIMAAEDYMDAFEKLQQLGLRGPQQREIVHVLLACCLQEKQYNPYYALLAQKLTEFDRKYQLSIQFSVWDKIKELQGLSKCGLANLAQLLTHLIMEKSLPLSILKVIEFSDLNKSTVRFMRQILLSIIMNEDLQASLEAFHRIAKSPKLHMFRESLRLFIQHFLVRNAGKKTTVLSEQEMQTLKQRTAEVDKLLTVHESKMRF